MLKGEKCLSPKCTMIKRPYAPGQHGQSFSKKQSEYGKQLREKQKARRIYGISEAQFSNCVESAEKQVGNTSLNLMQLLERRLDNVVYRAGFAASRSEARQIISHGKIVVNDNKVNIPSYILNQGDVTAPKKQSKEIELSTSGVPTWLDLDPKKRAVKVVHVPMQEEIDTTVNSSLIIEFYSR